jgi:hypothetical protein
VTAALSLPGAAGDHAVRLQLSQPDGREAEWFGRYAYAIVGRKGATYDVPIAFNDPPGRWRLVATELFSGRVTEAAFTVR